MVWAVEQENYTLSQSWLTLLAIRRKEQSLEGRCNRRKPAAPLLLYQGIGELISSSRFAVMQGKFAVRRCAACNGKVC